MQRAHEDKLATNERDLKLLRLQQRKAELETSKSPIRGAALSNAVPGHSKSMVMQTETQGLSGQNTLVT